MKIPGAGHTNRREAMRNCILNKYNEQFSLMTRDSMRMYSNGEFCIGEDAKKGNLIHRYIGDTMYQYVYKHAT